MNTVAQKNQIARINRLLAHFVSKLYTSRTRGEQHDLGDRHIVDAFWNAVIDAHVDLSRLENDLRAAE
jgi:hypothetical protein